MAGILFVRLQYYLLFVSCSRGFRLVAQGTLNYLLCPHLTMVTDLCLGGLYLGAGTSLGGGVGLAVIICCVKPVSFSISSVVMLMSSGLSSVPACRPGPCY